MKRAEITPSSRYSTLCHLPFSAFSGSPAAIRSDNRLVMHHVIASFFGGVRGGDFRDPGVCIVDFSSMFPMRSVYRNRWLSILVSNCSRRDERISLFYGIVSATCWKASSKSIERCPLERLTNKYATSTRCAIMCGKDKHPMVPTTGLLRSFFSMTKALLLPVLFFRQ